MMLYDSMSYHYDSYIYIYIYIYILHSTISSGINIFGMFISIINIIIHIYIYTQATSPKPEA